MNKSKKKTNKVLDYIKKMKCKQLELAKVIGITNVTLSLKISGKSNFTADEIIKIKEHFNMTAEEVDEIFLTK